MILPDVGPSAVAVDTETTGTHPDPPECARVTVVSIAWWADPVGGVIASEAYPVAFGLGRGHQPTLALDDDPNISEGDWRQLLLWLGQRRLVFAGAKFDLMMLGVGTDLWSGADLSANLRWDVQLASRDLDPGQAASLDAIEARIDYLDPEARATWLEMKKQRGQLNRMGWEAAREYAATDAEVTLAAMGSQWDRYESGEGRYPDFREDMELSNELLTLERRGIGYDAPTSTDVAQALARHEARIKRGLPFRPTVHGARRYYFSQLNYEPLSYTDGGAPRVDEQTIAKLVAEDAPYAKEFQLLRKLETARSKWYESYAAHCGWDGRLRTDFSLAKVVSGRLSSTRVNLQAIPHEYELQPIRDLELPTPRELFRARRPNQKLWELDLSQAELRVAAKEADCRFMLDLIDEGADIHGAVTREVFNDEPGSPTWDSNRQLGKRADFAFIFGVSAETFQTDLAKMADIWLPIAECNRIVHRWRRLCPEYGRAIKRYMAVATHWKYIRLVNGRVRHFSLWEEQHKAFNQYVQGSLAELMKMWMLEAERKHPGVVVLSVHDSLVLETGSPRIVASIREMGARIGTDLFGVPMVVDQKEWGK